MHMANHKSTKCLGISQAIKVSLMGNCTIYFFVIKAKEEAHPIILGRPWLMAIHAQQDWKSGLLTIQDATHGRRIVYNMRTRELESRMVPKLKSQVTMRRHQKRRALQSQSSQ